MRNEFWCYGIHHLIVHGIIYGICISGGIYLLLAMVAGWCGRYRRIGYWGFVFVSIIFTPIVSLLFIYFAAPKKETVVDTQPAKDPFVL
jgi:hypothetical protein